MDLFQSIKRNQVFRVLDQSSLETVAASATIKKFQKSEILVCQGEIWPFFFIVLTGAVMAVKDSEEGRSLVAATFGTGDIFWGLAFFDESAEMPAALEIFEDAQLALWTRDELMPVIKSNGAFSWELSKLMIHRMVQASEILEAMTFQPIAVRLARLLVGISKDEQAGPIERSLTLDEMAARIGSTREMVCRLLYKFSDEGLINITRTEFTVIDPKNLIRRAQK